MQNNLEVLSRALNGTKQVESSTMPGTIGVSEFQLTAITGCQDIRKQKQFGIMWCVFLHLGHVAIFSH